jgi:hypothetical protein
MNQIPELVVINTMVECLQALQASIQSQLAVFAARQSELQKLATSTTTVVPAEDKSPAGARRERGRRGKKKGPDPRPFQIFPDIPLINVPISDSSEPST